MSFPTFESASALRAAAPIPDQGCERSTDLAVRFLALPARPTPFVVFPARPSAEESLHAFSARALRIEAHAVLERPLFPHQLKTSHIPRPHLGAFAPSPRELHRDAPSFSPAPEEPSPSARREPAKPATHKESTSPAAAATKPTPAPALPSKQRKIRIDPASVAAKPHVRLVERSRGETVYAKEIAAAASAIAAAIGTARPAVVALLTVGVEPLHNLARGLAAAWEGDRVVLALATREGAAKDVQAPGWAELVAGERRLDVIQSLRPSDGYLELAPGAAQLVGRASNAETKRAIEVACQCGDVVLVAAGDVGDHRARTIAVAARQAVLAVRASTDRDAMREAAERLRQRGVHLVGVLGVLDN